jgi:hypothetical protein
MANACRSLVGNVRERDHLRDLRMKVGGGTVILKCILNRVVCELGFFKNCVI